MISFHFVSFFLLVSNDNNSCFRQQPVSFPLIQRENKIKLSVIINTFCTGNVPLLRIPLTLLTFSEDLKKERGNPACWIIPPEISVLTAGSLKSCFQFLFPFSYLKSHITQAGAGCSNNRENRIFTDCCHDNNALVVLHHGLTE